MKKVVCKPIIIAILVLVCTVALAPLKPPLGRKSRNSVLILIHGDNLGSHVSFTPPNQQMWVLWPYRLSDYGANRLLSIFTGFNWQGSGYDLSFRENSADSWVSNNIHHLEKTGYFKARSQLLGNHKVFPVSDKIGIGSVNRESLLLALDQSSASIKPVPYRGPWPEGAILVYEAHNWPDAIAMSREAQGQRGRAMIAEIPDASPTRWGRLWLSPKGWPDGFPVSPQTHMSGMLDARDIGRVLVAPNAVRWAVRPDAMDSYDSWFDHVQGFGSGVLTGLAFFLVFILGSAAYCIIIEERAPIASGLLIACAMAPTSFMITDNLSRIFGLDNWWLFLFGVSLGLSTIGFLFYAVTRKAFSGAHPLFWTCLVGCTAMLVTNPTWTIFSPVFSINRWTATGIPLGLLMAFLTGTVAFARNSAASWLARGLIVATLVLTAGGFIWLHSAGAIGLALPICALVIGEGWFRWPLLIVLCFLPTSQADPWHYGVVWAPVNSFKNFDDAKGLNLGGAFFALASPALLFLIMLVGATLLFGDRFLFRQMKMALKKDNRILALGFAGISLAAIAVLNPVFWSAAMICGYGLFIALFFDSVWAV